MVLLKNGFTQERKIGREFAEKEFEVKFEVMDKTLTLDKCLETVEKSLEGNKLISLDPVRTNSQIHTSFFTDGDTEYSLFRYDEKLMLKIKQHEILEYEEFGVFVNRESFIYDANEIRRIIELPQMKFAGSMIKNRIKDFLLDTSDGRIYSIAITLCEVAVSKQYQLEVEYNGYIQGTKELCKTELEIANKVKQMAATVYKELDGVLTPTLERKYEFVLKNTINQYQDIENKNLILQTI